MKKLISLIIISSFLLNFNACNSYENKKDSETSSNNIIEIITAIPFPNIKLDIPADYEVTSSDYIEEYYKKGDASIIVTSKSLLSDYDKTMDNVVYNALLEYKNISDTFEEVSNEITEIDDCEARIVELRYSILGKTDTLSMSCSCGFIIADDKLYLITASAPSKSYSNFKEEFKSVIQSAQIIK